jgi:hypothetical protein
MNFVWIAVLVALAIIAFIKAAELKHKLMLKVILVLVAFFLLTVGYVYFVNDISLKTYEGFISLGKAYFSWLGALFGNVGSITGYAVQQDWGLNSTAMP